MPNALGLSDEQFQAFEIFYPYAFNKTLEAASSKRRFVYYTSAETAMSILRNGEIWMRKSHLMNDYREIEHGFDCLNAAYKNGRSRMVSIFDSLFPGFCGRLEAAFNKWLPYFRTDTYITCLSEHDQSEDRYGRLSMWRAYGGTSGLALVVNAGPIIRPTQALKAHVSPVAYLDGNGVEKELLRVLTNVENNMDFIKAAGEEQARNNMFAAMRNAVVCTKHPGFREEREWRVIYSPRFAASERITTSIESVGGVPQSICRIPLRDVPEEGLYGLNPADFIERVIIGPSKFPAGIHDALLVLLADVGVQNPVEKIIVSDLPLRQ